MIYVSVVSMHDTLWCPIVYIVAYEDKYFNL